MHFHTDCPNAAEVLTVPAHQVCIARDEMSMRLHDMTSSALTRSVQMKLRPATNMCRPVAGGVARRPMPRGGERPRLSKPPP